MTAWGVLRDRDAGRYLAGVLVSGFGSSAMMLAAGIWVKSLTGSSSLAALVGVCLWTPTLAGPLLGTVVDRVRRRPLLVLVNAAMAALLPLLLVVRTADLVWILFAVLVLYGTASVLCDAAEAAVVTATVPGELRGDFNGLRMTANEAMKLLAPLAGAGLYVRYGGGSVAVLDAVTFALAAAVFAMVRVREEPPAPATTGWREQTAEGIRYLRRHPLLRRLVAVGSIAMLLSALGSSAIYAVVDAGLHRSPAFVGVLYAGQGAGSVVGGVVAGALLRRMPERVFAATGMLLFALGAAVRATPWVSAALIGGAAIGVGLPWVLIAALTAVQRETPAALIGRVAATASTLVFAPTAVGGLVGAGLVAVVDHRLLLAAVGTAGVLAAAYCLFQVPAAEADEVTSAADRGGQFFTDA
ncbi:MFS transporter [Streptomyces sp. So13.3]|uniref:MFS transporter n=1 Tax=Streptomyces TaxID=1883 RepID=UPI001106F1DE|nr:MULTISPECIES: MFS transporter [Streptomyces]QNA72645.1 MFS transporter [Streptomyces sp. So13.3]